MDQRKKNFIDGLVQIACSVPLLALAASPWIFPEKFPDGMPTGLMIVPVVSGGIGVFMLLQGAYNCIRPSD